MIPAVSVCKVCGSRDIRPLYQSQRYSFTVGRCRECKLTFVLDEVSVTALKQMYDDAENRESFTALMSNDNVRQRHATLLHEIPLYRTATTVPSGCLT